MAKKARAEAKRLKRLGRDDFAPLSMDDPDFVSGIDDNIGDATDVNNDNDAAGDAAGTADGHSSANNNNDDDNSSGSTLTNDQIMAKVEDLHQRYEEGLVDLDTFDEERTSLMAQISVD